MRHSASMDFESVLQKWVYVGPKNDIRGQVFIDILDELRSICIA